MPMMRVAGPAANELAQGLNERLNESLDKGMEPNVAAGILLALALDLYRANYGDLEARRFMKSTTRHRLAHPPAHWGIVSNRTHLDG